MPGQDKTGPSGEGPATGWGRGPCGRGLRRGFLGGGRGRRRFMRPVSDEKEVLKEELQDLKQQQQKIEKRLGELGE